MNHDEVVLEFKNWAATMQKTPYKEGIRNSLRGEIFKQVIKRLDGGEAIGSVYGYVMSQIQFFTGSNTNGAVWSGIEYRSIHQKLWGLQHKLK